MAPGKPEIPDTAIEAAERVMILVRAARSGTFESMPDYEFRYLWPSVAFLYPFLHPDSTNHGTDVCHTSSQQHPVLDVYPELDVPYYVESGWPLLLEPVLAEAWRRFDNSRLTDEEMYCTDAQCASLNWPPASRDD
jgi:hypothetical protein